MIRILAAALLVTTGAAAFAELPEGEKPPKLRVTILAGDRAGEKTCTLSKQEGETVNTYVVLSVTQKNDTYARFIKQFDQFVGKHKEHSLKGFVLLRNFVARKHEWAEELYADEALKNTSLVLMAEEEDFATWQPSRSYSTNAWFVRDGKLVKQWAVGCPLCADLDVKLSDTICRSFDLPVEW